MTQLSRRSLLQAAVGAVGVTWLTTGCAPYADAGSGHDFSPWDFPGDEKRPEFLAVKAAILAANPHNTQPWLFKVTASSVDVFADTSRALGAMDSLRREMFIGLGCALENAILTATAHGRAVKVTYLPSSDDTHAARLDLTPSQREVSELVGVIPNRRMNKFEYSDIRIAKRTLDGLLALADDSRVTLQVFTDPRARERIRQHTIDAIVAITSDEQMAEASHRWWRQTRAEVELTRDGLNLDIMGLDPVTRALAGTQDSVAVEQANAYWVDGTKGRHTTGAGYFVISSRNRNSRVEQLLTGRLFQRAHLYLTSRGVDAHTINMLPEMQDREETTNAVERPFSRACSEWVPPGWGFQMLTRVGYAFERAFHTPRRAAEDVLR